MELRRTRDERNERLDSGALHVFSLEEYTRALREEPQYREKGRNGVTVVKTPGLSMVLEVLRSGAELSEHRAPGPITVQLLEGEIRFHAEGERFELRPGQMLALPASRPHSVQAARDSAFLITIALGARKEATTP